MRPEGSPAELERRRRRGLALVQQGYSLHAVARHLSCHASSVMRWHDAFARGGRRSLRPSRRPGRGASQDAAEPAGFPAQVAKGGDSTKPARPLAGRAALAHPPDPTTPPLLP